jgi:hypothetical protein
LIVSDAWDDGVGGAIAFPPNLTKLPVFAAAGDQLVVRLDELEAFAASLPRQLEWFEFEPKVAALNKWLAFLPPALTQLMLVPYLTPKHAPLKECLPHLIHLDIKCCDHAPKSLLKSLSPTLHTVHISKMLMYDSDDSDDSEFHAHFPPRATSITLPENWGQAYQQELLTGIRALPPTLTQLELRGVIMRGVAVNALPNTLTTLSMRLLDHQRSGIYPAI